jgi:tRNA-2-methylthio-N6-dimethylallyladenosine synthase
MTGTKKLYVKTYGCQMNVYDSERMAEALGADGYEQVESPEGADMILLNTCHIREKAAEKVYSELGRFKPLKKEANPDLKIGVAGCVAQAEGEEIMRRQPMVDLVVGPQTYHRLPEDDGGAGRGKGARHRFPRGGQVRPSAQGPQGRRGPTAFLTVQEGCDKFCSFCVVPYTRGAEVSRPVARLMREARDLVERGVREITLLGQNVNAYHGQGGGRRGMGACPPDPGDGGIDGLDRIRFTTSHPNDMDDDLIAAHGDCEKLMPYLHLPVQVGSDRILKAMNRKHTGESYIRLIERIRAARPDLAAVGRFHRGLPRRNRGGFPGHARSGRRGRLRQRLFLQVFAAPRHAGGRTRAGRSGRGRRPAAAASGASDETAARGTGRDGRARGLGPVREAGADAGPDGGQVRVSPRRACRRPSDLLGRIAAVDIVESGPNSLSGVLR